MSEAMSYGGVTEADLPAVTRMIVHAFAGTEQGTQEWLTFAGHENLRVVKGKEGGLEARTAQGHLQEHGTEPRATGGHGTEPRATSGHGTEPRATATACLLRIPMGQYFGGRAVSMVGIAGVGVAPEARGRGHAKRLMQEAVKEAARDGFALSALYPSTQSLYRAVGYEQAGHRMIVRLPLAAIDVRESGLDVVPLGEEDWPAVKASYARFAPRFDGMLERGAYIWGRIPKWHDQKFHGFGVRNAAGGLDGHVFVAQKRKESGRQEIAVQDLAFVNAAAGRRLLRFFADFGTMGDDVVFAAGPSHPALMLLGLQKYAMEFKYAWMVRVTDVAKALAERGYAPGVDAEVHLEVEDELVPANDGRFVVRVRDGKGEVGRGGRGELKVGIRGLAAMYTGYLSAAGLMLAGLASGEERALATAGAVFGGAGPWMTDFF